MKYKNNLSGMLAVHYADLFVDQFRRISSSPRPQPWVCPTAGVPQNITGNCYSGVNTLVLNMAQSRLGAELPLWMTPYQALSLGLDFSGAKTTKVVAYKPKFVTAEGEYTIYYDPLRAEMLHIGMSSVAPLLRVMIQNGTVKPITPEQFQTLSDSDKALCRRTVSAFTKGVVNICQTDFAQRYPQLYAEALSYFQEGKMFSLNCDCLDAYARGEKAVLSRFCQTLSEGEGPTRYQTPEASDRADTVLLAPKSSYQDDRYYYADMCRAMVRQHIATQSQSSAAPLERSSEDPLRQTALREMTVELCSAMLLGVCGVPAYLSEQSLSHMKSWAEIACIEPEAIYERVFQASAAHNSICSELGLCLDSELSLSEKVEQSYSQSREDRSRELRELSAAGQRPRRGKRPTV